MIRETKPQRISVIGTPGSGKTTYARALAMRLGIPHVEMDSHFWLPGWTERPRADFQAEINRLSSEPAWVIDGNYNGSEVQGGLLWPRADTVVWLDLPKRVVMSQLVARTVRRVITRKELWSGNREPWSNLMSADPDKSIIAWAWTKHAAYTRRYTEAMNDPRWGGLNWVRLRSRAQMAEWLSSL